MSRRDKGCVTTGIMMLSPARSVGTESYETTVVRSGGARRAPRQFFQFLVSNRLTSHSSQSKLMPDGRTLACRGGAGGAVWYSQNVERWQKQGAINLCFNSALTPSEPLLGLRVALNKFLEVIHDRSVQVVLHVHQGGENLVVRYARSEGVGESCVWWR